ncbi:MAG: Do family serine endopeptidase [Robiginitomaculum sp.]|nr:Do family serine endopeptidase [Robiginitomaculum sp.]MDQ7077938.1 Do family serine endopeptidase [Robiginitomaculum sp.]
MLRLRSLTWMLAGLALWLAPPALSHPAPDGFAKLAARLSPSVVNISTSQKVEGDLPLFPKGSPLERFNDTFGRGGPRTENSLGSGFVIDPDGIIITNDHVIKGADEIDVTFPDGTTLVAEVVGHDAATDLAVLRVQPERPLPAVPLGDSDTALSGDWVLAIGNPFGLGGSLSVGIISARNRDIQSGQYDDFIQTDAAINRGNSGGPLFNMDGEVIGVNSAILSPSGGSVGIGFAIPSNLVRQVAGQLLKYGHTRRGWLGVSVRSITREVAQTFGLDKARGALVVSVTSGGPAQKAGLEVGDLITRFDGQDIADSRALTRIAADSEIGRKVKVHYIRGKKPRVTSVTIGRLQEDDDEEANARASTTTPTSGQVMGISLSVLDNTLRRRYNIRSDVAGLVVTDIAVGSDAASKIRVGDVVEEIGWKAVASVEDAKARVAELEKTGKGPVAFLINRHGELLPRALKY